jgi:hypothetical protein
MPVSSVELTGEQIRAGRALARIEQVELARLAKLSLETVKRLERIRGPVFANIRTVNAIVAAFEEIGIFFDGCEEGGIGVCRAPPNGIRSDRLRRRGATPGGTFRLIYTSRASARARAAMRATLGGMHDLGSERRARKLTGVLYASNGRFLEVLEGERDAVLDAFARLSADGTHTDIQILESRGIPTPQFADWSFCCGLFRSDRDVFAGEPAMMHGFAPELLTAGSALDLLAKVRDLQHSEPRLGRGDPRHCSVCRECLELLCA